MPVIDTKPTAAQGEHRAGRPAAAPADPAGRQTVRERLAGRVDGAERPLGRLLALGKKQKVTWLVDPAMLDEAAPDQAGLLRVVGGNNQTKPGTGQKIVAAWLEGLRRQPRPQPGRPAPVRRPGRGQPDRRRRPAEGPGRPVAGPATERVHPGRRCPHFDRGLWLENGSATSRNLAAASTGYPAAPTRRPEPGQQFVLGARRPAEPAPRPRSTTSRRPRAREDRPHCDGGLRPDHRRSGPGHRRATRSRCGSGSPPRPRCWRVDRHGYASSVVALPPRGWDTEGGATAPRSPAGSVAALDHPDRRSTRSSPPRRGRRPARHRQRTARSTPGLTSGQLDQIKQLNNATATYVTCWPTRSTRPRTCERALLRALLQLARIPRRGPAVHHLSRPASVNHRSAKVHLVNNGRRHRASAGRSRSTCPAARAPSR